jgi:hypothetical protein
MSRHRIPAGPRIRSLLGAAFVAAAALQAPAVLAQGATPSTLQDVRKAWAAAVLKRDAPAAAAFAAFPFQNEAYQDVKTFGRAAYLRNIEGWSTQKACLANEPIKPDRSQRRLGTHSFNCDGHGFFFARKNGVWRHTGYENSNE